MEPLHKKNRLGFQAESLVCKRLMPAGSFISSIVDHSVLRYSLHRCMKQVPRNIQLNLTRLFVFICLVIKAAIK